MVSGVGKAIRQGKPFGSVEQEAFLSLCRAAADLQQEVAEVLRPSGLSASQYNVLRILRGAGDAGLSCGEIVERLVARDPDLTRLLDRLERRDYVSRARDAADRRVVTTRITERGLEVLAALDGPIAALHERQLGHLGAMKLRQLMRLLEEAAGVGR
jgi:DNA-binding MarR family transcriptional regulator